MIPLARWVAPFGDPRINGRSPLPSAFRSVPRPSSPLGAKASTRCPFRAAFAPSPEHARSEVRRQRISLPTSLRRPGRCANGSPGRCTAHRPHAYPCSRPDLTSCEMMAGPASHGHDSLHDFNRTQGKAAPTDRTVRRARLAHDPRSRCQRTRQGPSRPPLCVLRHPSSPTPVGGLAHACWWAWADLNGRPHAYQACALTS